LRDRSDLGALLAAATREIADRRGSSLRLASLPGDPEELLAHLLEDPGVSVLVAVGVDALDGFALLSLDPPQLRAVYVAASKRRRGVARALVATATSHCLERGSGAPTVLAAAGDRAEKSLYEALGYRAELLVMAPRARATVVDQHHE
jgi:GNAT superfamily N-acetyltransferase